MDEPLPGHFTRCWTRPNLLPIFTPIHVRQPIARGSYHGKHHISAEQ